jgi:hypothetical protein
VISREFQSNLKQHAEKWGITTSIRNSALALTLVVALACFSDSVAHAAHEAVSLLNSMPRPASAQPLS